MALNAQGPTTVASTIPAGADTTSARITLTLNAAGAVYDEPQTHVWQGNLSCEMNTKGQAEDPTGRPAELDTTVTPLDPEDGAPLRHAEVRAPRCGPGGPPNPVPCEPHEACTRSWRVTFHRPSGLEGTIHIRWRYNLFIHYTLPAFGRLDEVPPGAKLTKSITTADPTPAPRSGTPSPEPS